jgi:hypothetical protein
MVSAPRDGDPIEKRRRMGHRLHGPWATSCSRAGSPTISMARRFGWWPPRRRSRRASTRVTCTGRRPALRCLRQESVEAQYTCGEPDADFRQRQQRDVRIHSHDRSVAGAGYPTKEHHGSALLRVGDEVSIATEGEPGSSQLRTITSEPMVTTQRPMQLSIMRAPERARRHLPTLEPALLRSHGRNPALR